MRDALKGTKMSDEKKFYTDNGVEITPGLRVMTNDWRWGTVEASQFTDGGLTYPGGEYFDGWFYVIYDGQDGRGSRFNGERMTTYPPIGAPDDPKSV
jgi:hypothetical protein